MARLSAPWVTYANGMEALFKYDPQVRVVLNEEEYELKIFVEDDEKADALRKLIPYKKEFGNVVLTINIIPADQDLETKINLFKKAFENNPVVTRFVTRTLPDFPASYIVFKKEVVQFYNDNLADVNGNLSTLYECIAADIFEDHDGIFFCTDNQ